jgi:hypothetical protein
MKKVRFNLSKNKTILFFKNDSIANIKDNKKLVKKKSRINMLIPIIPLFILILILITHIY